MMRDIVLWAMGLVSGWFLRMIVESHTRQKCSIPRSRSLDTLKRMHALASKKGDEDVSHPQKNIPDRRCLECSEAYGKWRLRLAEKEQRLHDPSKELRDV